MTYRLIKPIVIKNSRQTAEGMLVEVLHYGKDWVQSGITTDKYRGGKQVATKRTRTLERITYAVIIAHMEDVNPYNKCITSTNVQELIKADTIEELRKEYREKILG